MKPKAKVAAIAALMSGLTCLPACGAESVFEVKAVQHPDKRGGGRGADILWNDVRRQDGQAREGKGANLREVCENAPCIFAYGDRILIDANVRSSHAQK